MSTSRRGTKKFALRQTSPSAHCTLTLAIRAEPSQGQRACPQAHDPLHSNLCTIPVISPNPCIADRSSQQPRGMSDLRDDAAVHTDREPFSRRLRIRVLGEVIVRILVSVLVVVVVLHKIGFAALSAQVIRIPKAVRSNVGAVEEVVTVQVSVRGEWAVVTELHVEYVDAIVFLWFTAANEEKIGEVAHIGVWDPW